MVILPNQDIVNCEDLSLITGKSFQDASHLFHSCRFALPLKRNGISKAKTWEEIRIRDVMLDEGFDALWKYRKY